MTAWLRLLSTVSLLPVFLSILSVARAAEPLLAWELGPTGSQASLRGLSTPDDQTVWACGSGGTVLLSQDGGSSWTNCSPAGFGDLEFRSLHGFDSRTACVASAGTPAVILRTTNGGQDWHEVYRNSAPKAFFDALRFSDDSRGIAFSDPVDGRLLIVETQDGGRNWQSIVGSNQPTAEADEAGFAASNSALHVSPDGAAWIGTGGTRREQSRIYWRISRGSPWQISHCPIPSGPAEGVFSIAGDSHLLVAVGGDYRPDATSNFTACISRDQGKSWSLAAKQPPAFRSAVVSLPQGQNQQLPAGWICVGPSGSDFSVDANHWTTFSQHGFHALSASANQVFAVGADGRFARLIRAQTER